MTQHSMPTAKAIITFILAALFLCLEMALQVSPSVMSSELMRDLHLTEFGLGIMSGSYFITYTIMQIPSGLLYDRLSFRYIVSSAVAICAVGAGLTALAHILFTGAVARLFTGFASAFAFLSVLTTAARYFDHKYFALLAGIAQLLAALGAIGGEFPIAFLVQHVGWRHTMLILMAVGLLLAVTLWLFLKFAIDCDQPQQKGSEKVSSSIKAISKNTQTWFVALYAFCNWAPVTAFTSLWGVPFLAAAYHLTTIKAASLISLTWLGIGLLSPVAGVITDKMKQRRPVLILSSLLGLVSITLIVYAPNLPLWLLSTLLFIAGAGSVGQLISFAVIRDITSPKRISTAIGFNNMAVVASGILVQPLVGGVIDWLNHGNAHHVSVNQFQHALIILPVAFAICLLLSLFFIKESLKRS